MFIPHDAPTHLCEPERHQLWRVKETPLLKCNAQIDVNHLGRAAVQQDVLQAGAAGGS